MFKKIVSLAVLSTIATGVFAAGTGPDLTPLTSVVDFGTVITAVMAIAGLLAGVYVAIKGAKIVIGMVRGA
ncbi:hypothetical protein [Chromobacterium violaceum]|uniref:hypothetical protein n=1 Tax=Chromobacterium violaceum TaxID=536 RepID=UPI001B32775B|nr:hypothetical protein [Chromobacterium violaceum]MBP4045190.1 hypothetical protein [Chromobacterium violaceum]